MDEFDVVVIGAGPAGEVVAGRCADGGLAVAVVEQELVGGECSYWGCIPSKTLIRPGDLVAAARRAPGARQAVTGTIDVPAVLARRDYMTGEWRDDAALPWLQERGIALLRGTGRLTGPRTVEVRADDRATQAVRARRAVVLATGTRAALPPIPGLAEAAPWDNRDATEVRTLPRRLIVIGGGAVGVEMAQAYRRLDGVQVTVLEAAPRLLAREEPFAGDEVRAGLEADGIRVITGAVINRVRRDKPDNPVSVEVGSERVDADQLLVAAGRTIRVEELGLDTIGIRAGRAVTVDKQLRVPGVADGWLYAVGDCTGLAQLTHMGKYHGRVAADVILGRDVRDSASADVVPRVTFTDPQVCAVGLTEAQARDRGLPVRTVTCPVAEVPGAYTQGEGIGGTGKLVIDEQRGVVVGATFTGPGLQELLHSATVAIAGEVPLERLMHAVPAFPTISEVWLHLLERYGL